MFLLIVRSNLTVTIKTMVIVSQKMVLINIKWMNLMDILSRVFGRDFGDMNLNHTVFLLKISNIKIAHIIIKYYVKGYELYRIRYNS